MNKLKKEISVTICIPMKDAESYIAEAISSCLDQTFKGYEILVVDNNSGDSSVSIVKNFRSNKIRLIQNKADIGIIRNFNVCIKHAKGKYLKFLCADDLLNPLCLEEMLKAFKKYPNASLVTSNRFIINSKSLITKKIKFPSITNEIDGYKVINECLFGANFIGEPTAVMFKKIDASRGFSTEYKHLFDLEMWFQLLEKGTLINTKKFLCSVRRHNKQMTISNIKSGALLADNKFLYKNYVIKNYINKDIYLLLKWRLLYFYRFFRYAKIQPLLNNMYN